MAELVRKHTPLEHFSLFLLLSMSGSLRKAISAGTNSNMKHQRRKSASQRWTEGLLSEVWKIKTLSGLSSKPQILRLINDHNAGCQSISQFWNISGIYNHLTTLTAKFIFKASQTVLWAFYSSFSVNLLY